MKRWLLTTAVLALSTASALAYDVYPTCSTPGAGFGVMPQSWWLDPVNGKSPADGGDGSYAKPWNSMDGVASGKWTQSRTPPVAGYTRPLLASVPYNHLVDGSYQNVADNLGNPPVHPGDTLNLKSGNYGDWMIGDWQQKVVNSNFVTVQAGPGQVPMFSTIYLRATNKWVLDGLKVESLFGDVNKGWLITITDSGAALQTTDIILSNMTVQSMADAHGLTQAEAQAKLRWGFHIYGSAGDGTNGMPFTTCVSMTNSKVRNVRNGVVLSGNKTWFGSNEIDHFWDDGLVYAATDVTITKNFIHDNSDAGDGNHEDAMQGQNGALASGVVYNKFANITIDSNRITRQLDPKLPFPVYLQGIDAFDEDWTNVKIANNVIVTSACWGISSHSSHKAVIASNTIALDPSIPVPNCVPIILGGGTSHQGPDSSDVYVANNFAPEIDIDNSKATTVTWANNVATSKLVSTIDGNPVWNGKEGFDAWNNLVTKAPLTSLVRAWDPPKQTFDMTPAWNSEVIGRGTASGVPSVDVLGKPRVAPLTAGAYGYPF